MEQMNKRDSLARLEDEFNQKNVISKYERNIDGYSEKINRKDTITTPRKSESHLRLFGSMENIYDMIAEKKNIQTL